MGCGNSSETEGRKEEEHGFFHRRPKVSIRVGQHVEEVSKDETLVVFVFGKYIHYILLDMLEDKLVI